MASRDHARLIRFALDCADTLARAYVIVMCGALLWVLFRRPHMIDTRWIVGAFSVAAMYTAWPRRSSAAPIPGDKSRDEP